MVETRDAKKRRTNCGEEDGGSDIGSAAAGHKPQGSTNDDIMKMVISMQQSMRSMKNNIKKMEARCIKLKEDNDDMNDKLSDVIDENERLEDTIREIKEESEESNEEIDRRLSEVEDELRDVKSSFELHEKYSDADIERLEDSVNDMREEMASSRDVERIETKVDELEAKVDEMDDTIREVKENFEEHEQEDSSFRVKLDINSIYRSLSDVRYTLKAAALHQKSLRDNKRWENPVPWIQSSYWYSRGYDQLTTNIMHALEDDIRGLTRYMRVNGGSDGQIILNFDDLPFPIHYDDIMYPLWLGRCSMLLFCFLFIHFTL